MQPSYLQIEANMPQADLNVFYHLSFDLQLCFNVSKGSFLHFDHLNQSQLGTLDRDHIPAKNIEKDLDIALSTNLKFITYITSAV